MLAMVWPRGTAALSLLNLLNGDCLRKLIETKKKLRILHSSEQHMLNANKVSLGAGNGWLAIEG